MAKKLLGDRTVGNQFFAGGSIISNEDAAAAGFDASDTVDVQDGTVAASAPASASQDAHADVDSAEKNEAEQSNSSGAEGEQGSGNANNAPAAGSESEASASQATKRTLTEQDLIDNPELVEKGLKVGDEVDAVVKP